MPIGVAKAVSNSDLIAEGVNNLYHTNDRVNALIEARIVNLDEATNGQILTSNGDGTSTFVESTSDLIQFSDPLNCFNSGNVEGVLGELGQIIKKASITADNPAVAYPETGSKINVTVSEATDSSVFVKRHKKNYFDKDNALYLSNAVMTDTGGGNWYIVGGAGSVHYIAILPNKTYTVSKQGGDRFYIGVTNETPAQLLAITKVVINNAATSLTITAGANTKYLVMKLSTSTTGLADILATVMVEENDVATEYESYNGTTQNVSITDGVGTAVFDAIEGDNVIWTNADSQSVGYITNAKQDIAVINTRINTIYDYSIFNNAYIKDQTLICNPTPKEGETYVAKYTGIDIGDSNVPSKILCKAIFTPGDTGGSAVLISNPIGLTYDYHITTKSLHCVFSDMGARIGLFDDYTETVALTYTYTASCARNGKTEYTFGFEISGTTVKLICADGTEQSVTVANIAEYIGRYCTLEHFGNTADMCMPMFTRFEIEVGGVKTMWDNFKRFDGAIGVAPSGHRYVQINTIDD